MMWQHGICLFTLKKTHLNYEIILVVFMYEFYVKILIPLQNWNSIKDNSGVRKIKKTKPIEIFGLV